MIPRLAALLLAIALPGAQRTTQNPGPATRSVNPSAEQEKDNLPMTSPIKLLKYQHEEIKKDMDKLVKLVNQVQEELDKAGENVLPLNTLKKLDEVEKLTKKIRGRIRQ